ncbi:DUF2726 domain-containing protein [uncultured Desulfuromonas sp.]|uniref:DUF2726 domain-containing protein n=1 Tax=uncultured Desulfuromonas sp. TaxID=181013 RepID=UPI002AABC006|nr:DUF2726 domain-containing protein [uncultured Desulfuromonas sp.]
MNFFDLLSGQGVFLFFFAFVLFFIALAARFVSSRSASSSCASYKRLGALLTPSERSFYGVLCQSVSEDVVVCPKVRVADVLSVEKTDRSSWQRAFNRIAMKHFDFVVCDRADFSVRYAVELDDSSHLNLKRAERDKFVDSVCRSSLVPLVRIKAQSGYSIAAIAGTIKAELDSQKEEFDF